MVQKIIDVMPACDSQEAVLSKINLHDAMKILKVSWAAVTAETIKNCYEKVGIQKREDETEDESMEAEIEVDEVSELASLLQAMGSDLTTDEFLAVEDGEDVAESEQSVVDEDAMVAFINDNNNEGDLDGQESDDEDSSSDVTELTYASKLVSDEQLTQALALVQTYMAQNPDLRTNSLDDLSRKVSLKKLGQLKQKKITDYLGSSAAAESANADSEDDIMP